MFSLSKCLPSTMSDWMAFILLIAIGFLIGFSFRIKAVPALWREKRINAELREGRQKEREGWKREREQWLKEMGRMNRELLGVIGRSTSAPVDSRGRD